MTWRKKKQGNERTCRNRRNKNKTKQQSPKPFKVVIADAPPCGYNEKDQNEVSLELSILPGWLFVMSKSPLTPITLDKVNSMIISLVLRSRKWRHKVSCLRTQLVERKSIWTKAVCFKACTLKSLYSIK